MTQEETVKKKPIVNANEHGVSVAIWENESKQGKEYKSISLSASSKQPDGSYKTRTIFFPSDLENLINALQKLKQDADEQGIITAFQPKEIDGGD